MKLRISELIERLEKEKLEHGDVPVLLADRKGTHEIGYIYVQKDMSKVLVID